MAQPENGHSPFSLADELLLHLPVRSRHSGKLLAERPLLQSEGPHEKTEHAERKGSQPEEYDVTRARGEDEQPPGERDRDNERTNPDHVAHVERCGLDQAKMSVDDRRHARCAAYSAAPGECSRATISWQCSTARVRRYRKR